MGYSHVLTDFKDNAGAGFNGKMIAFLTEATVLKPENISLARNRADYPVVNGVAYQPDVNGNPTAEYARLPRTDNSDPVNIPVALFLKDSAGRLEYYGSFIIPAEPGPPAYVTLGNLTATDPASPAGFPVVVSLGGLQGALGLAGNIVTIDSILKLITLTAIDDRGAYSAATTYDANDVVDYLGTKWRCKVAGTTGVTPVEGASWTQFIPSSYNPATHFANDTSKTGVALASPTAAPTLQTAATGGTLAAGTYRVSYTYKNQGGETVASPEATITTTGTTSTITATCGALPVGATDVNVYMTAAGGAAGTGKLQGSYNTGTQLVITAYSGAGADDPATNTTGLIFGYLAGARVTSAGAGAVVAAGVLGLTASATNYVEVDPENGTISKNTSAFTTSRKPIAEVVTNATTVTAVTDRRTWFEHDASGSGVSNLDDLGDVLIASPAAKHVLAYNTGDSRWENCQLAFADLSDMDDTGKDTGDVLTWDGTAGKWEAQPPAAPAYPVILCEVYRATSDQAISAGATTKIQWNGETTDVNGDFDSSTNYRFTAPATGEYQVDIGTNPVRTAAGTNSYNIKLYKNGAEIAQSGRYAANNTEWQSAHAFTMSLKLTSGDYLEVYLGTEQAVNLKFGQAKTWWTIKRTR